MGDAEILKQMGERIFKRRKNLKLTQEQLAERIGVSTQMISNLELGKKAIRPENLIKICDALDVSADYILTGKDSQNSISTLFEKLNRLSSEELSLVEGIVDYMNRK